MGGKLAGLDYGTHGQDLHLETSYWTVGRLDDEASPGGETLRETFKKKRDFQNKRETFKLNGRLLGRLSKKGRL